MTDHGDDVISILTTDHREVEDLFTELERLLAVGDPEQVRDVTDKVIIELVKHSVAEEAYLYPATRKFVPGGDALADTEIAEHAEAEELMKELERTDTTDLRFAELLTTLIKDVREHAAEEESQLFPQLAQHADADELRKLGSKINAIKKVAPTRPHPSAPDTPPANKLLAPGAGLVDRIRDLVSGRGKD
ncbi:hemerythrin domain-containing protein [Nonomuraea sediminis]|uniref:hemerythrin domain-containing protein n=1 Tax=Nonomuraea sediminis TaxID=2835864 RepID=UPI001BDBB6CA|nr:hemerythrin domain-containing protein [Nonomuraea sediminis]